MCLLCFGISLILGSFLPIWAFLPAEILYLGSYTLSIGDIFNAISAGLLLICVLSSMLLKKMLSTKIFSFLGNISMYLYVFHFSIMCSFACGFFVFVSEYCNNYIINALCSILCGILVTVFGTVLLKKIIDKMNKKLLNIIYIAL